MPIKTPTVFVLGAGGSGDYGFPIGAGLRNEVCRLCENPTGYSLFRQLGHSDSDIRQFLDELRHSGYRSVDAFLERNPDFLEIGKRAIAAALLPFEATGRLFPPDAIDEHWYELLANHMEAGFDSWHENRLSVITFNYDRSFEHYFTRVITQRRKTTAQEAYKEFKAVPVIHVHGSLGTYLDGEANSIAYGSDTTADNVLVAAQQILVVSEVEDTLPTFDEALVHLEAASRIYFLGFGFHGDNVRRLRFFNRPPSMPSPIVWGTAQGFSPTEWSSIETNVLNRHWNVGGRQPNLYGFLKNDAPLD